jgi:hypothetical protein
MNSPSHARKSRVRIKSYSHGALRTFDRLFVKTGSRLSTPARPIVTRVNKRRKRVSVSIFRRQIALMVVGVHPTKIDATVYWPYQVIDSTATYAAIELHHRARKNVRLVQHAPRYCANYLAAVKRPVGRIDSSIVNNRRYSGSSWLGVGNSASGTGRVWQNCDLRR